VTLYLRSRQRLALAAAVLGVFLLGCFLFGVLSVRNTTQGIMLIGVTFCLVVYWARPEAMLWLALFLSFAALPQGLHIAKVMGPVTIYASHVILILAICYLIPMVRPRFSNFFLPAMFALTVVYFAAVGYAIGHDAAAINHEVTFLLEMVAGFVLAVLIVYGNFIKGVMQAVAVTLWFSAGMAVLSSSGIIRLAGRLESLEGSTGDAASRVITTTLTPSIAAMSALVAAQVVGKVRLSAYLVFGLPSLIISLLAFSRNTLISLTVAAVVAFLANLGWSAIRRTAGFLAIGAAILAVTIPGALFLLQHSSAGAWLGNQFTAFNHRVLGGVSSSALAVDSSTLDRLAEDANLDNSIARAPLFGHGLGYAYQLPFGKDPNEFTNTLGTTYAHNFYLWWLVKSGAVGMGAFALFSLAPLFRALRSASKEAKICAAVSTGLLVMCIVDPLPEDTANALTLGMALGASLAFAKLRRNPGDAEPSEAATNAEDAEEAEEAELAEAVR
jgi:O-antigen ligase